MPLKTIVKVSHVSNLSDARYCAGMGVEMLGFQVVPGGEHYIAPEVFQDIRGWISGPRIVAELYGLADITRVEEIIRTYAPDYLEMTWDQYQTFGKDAQLPCIVQPGDGPQAAIGEAHQTIAYLLAAEATSCHEITGAGKPVLKKITTLRSLLKSLEQGCFSGFVLEGAKETRPGITNYDQLGEILEALEDE